VKNFIIGIIIAIVTTISDQYSKAYVFSMLLDKDSHEMQILPFFNLVVVHNFGVSFGMFNNVPYGHLILSVVAIAITVILLVWMWRAKKLYLTSALGLIIGGAIGNITDRVIYGAVADFLDFHIGEYHWPAFNVADSCVFVGVALILLENFFTAKGEENVQNV
jgi:signal peptidase II